jgi:hypothetical protein
MARRTLIDAASYRNPPVRFNLCRAGRTPAPFKVIAMI